MFGVVPRMDLSDPASLIQTISEEHHRLGILAPVPLCPKRNDTKLQRLEKEGEVVQSRESNSSCWVLVVHL